jgi:heptosyltransferase-2
MAQIDTVQKILFITLSNLGDGLMTLPAFDHLRRTCREARITVVASPRTKILFEHHPDVDELVVFDKHASLRHKIDLFFRFRRAGYDVVVDLKNTFYRWGVPARFKNPAIVRFPSWAAHEHERHLYKAMVALAGKPVTQEDLERENGRRNPSFIEAKDHDEAEGLLRAHGLRKDEPFVLVVPGARSDLKRWASEGYVEVINALKKTYGLRVVLSGQKADELLHRSIKEQAPEDTIDLCGRTSFGALCALVLRARLVIANDSGAVHVASYLERPVIAIFGPSDEKRYGPWSKEGLVVRKNVLCAPCGRAQCRRQDPVCIRTVRSFDVLLAARLVLEGGLGRTDPRRYQRILLVRTDRIGDLLLTTPVFKSLREHYPASFIAALVSSATRAIVDGNPYIDEVIVLDKEKKHQGFLATLRLAQEIRRRRFDVAVILHPTVRVHFLCYLAGLRERIGYDRKAPYFLTRTIPHRKQEGARHESAYNFDLLEPLGVTTASQEMYMPVDASSERAIEEVLRKNGLEAAPRLVALHPSASCPSKRWPLDRFGHVIDALVRQEKARVVIIGGPGHEGFGRDLARLAREQVVDLSGQLDLGALASLLRRCRLLISNDSGPVHLAAAVGTPVISIFGRRQPGLSPRRWAPLGASSVSLHHETDCAPCLAHACVRGFKCLMAVTEDEVLGHARRILRGPVSIKTETWHRATS